MNNYELGITNDELNGTTKDIKSTKVMPQIRFKGFSDAWEEKALGECLLVQRGGSPRPIEEYMTNGENGINWIKIGDVSPDSRYITKTQEKIKPEGEKHSRKVFVGDLIFSNSMSFGRPYIMQIEGCIHDGWLLLRDEKKAFNLEYLLQLLSSDLMLDQYKALASGGVVNNLNSQLVQSTSLIFPTLPEQTAIGSFFKTLDSRIASQGKKIEKLNSMKKALLAKMFPSNNYELGITNYELNKPVIRFKGFTDAWEEKELGECCKITMGQSPLGINYTDNPNDNILVQGNADMKDGYVVPRVWTTQITKKADVNDIIMSVRAPVGEVGKTLYNIVIGRGVSAIKGNEFIFQSLKKMNENNYWKQFSAGSTFDSINSDTLYTANITIPSTVEQEKIGSFFKKIDELIGLSNKELEQLKNIKSALLEKMFV